ncbi:MAG: phosphoribosylamine--glycine ligase [Candidatus Diapherotrites archaeon]
MDSAIVIGSGAREHAIAWALAKSNSLNKVYCTQGNAGTASDKKLENISFKDFRQTMEFIKKNKTRLVVIGPEKPLSEGIADLFRAKGIKAFGFGKRQAMLESSKSFARSFCKKYNVQSPNFWEFSDTSDAISFFEKNKGKFFVKADELCAGKGAIPAKNRKEGINAVKQLLVEKKCGIGKKIIVEEWIEGSELTIMAFTDGKTFSLMPASKDHKRLLDGNKGPNTGGMGAFAPAPLFSNSVKKKFRKKILEPTLKGLEIEKMHDPGILYFGLIVDKKNNPFLLEFNVRFGDPETQPVLMLLESDLLEILEACCDGCLDRIAKKIKWKQGSAIAVTLAAQGYPEKTCTEKREIKGISEAEKIDGVKVFHAGTALEGNKIVTAGGRILSVTSFGKSLEEARKKAYSAVKKISFKGMQFRKDIGRAF